MPTSKTRGGANSIHHTEPKNHCFARKRPHELHAVATVKDFPTRRAAMDVLMTASQDSGDYTILEVTIGGGRLAAAAQRRDGWEMAGAVDVGEGWSAVTANRLPVLLKDVQKKQPDLVVVAPRPWTATSSSAATFWENRRAQLPLWRWVVELWGRQDRGRRLVTLVQPAHSQAVHDFMKERRNMTRIYVSLCAFGRKVLPGQARELVVEVNDRMMARALQARSWCQCGPGAHLALEATPGKDKGGAL